MKKLIYFVFISIIVFTLNCGDSPLESALDYEPNLGPEITLGSASGSIYSGYVLRTGSITFDFSQDKPGYYNIQVLDSSNAYVSGTGINAWISYNTENQIVPIVVYSPNSSAGHDTFFNGSGTFTVQINSRDLNNFESSDSKTFTVAPLNSIILDGAGSPDVNGCYVRITSYNFFRPGTQYTVNYRKNGTPEFYISVDDSMPGSHIHTGNSDGYVEYYTSYNTTVPPSLVTANWFGGVAPRPTFYLNN
ncbi:MAG: hypothetical protein CVV49_07125 [Spirochaetae bacterium HGW-Spirochaetae-5]|nr:MAG: hypothetical protein CVV49_07125 [Spirochaetae bacterium HGW-Spirochaetae-5]